MTRRLKITIHGLVQGVGFRPFIYNLAKNHELSGLVKNSPQGVIIEAQGPESVLKKFCSEIQTEKPAHSFIHSLEYSWLDLQDYKEFQIIESDNSGTASALVMPDIALCYNCLRELNDSSDRRYRYPFINCTHCGPRFTIIKALPYDRAMTTMAGFMMCPECAVEYADPADRRFHAQPDACPVCGPGLSLLDEKGGLLAEKEAALKECAVAIGKGKLAAVKGLGGFHLVCSADNAEAVRELRKRKKRDEKPFALMFPDLETVKSYCKVSRLEEELLLSPQAPIVLLQKNIERDDDPFYEVTGDNPYLGIMLPYTPLHHLLLAECGKPLVATSANLSDEPLCIDNDEALGRLEGITDVFLCHNRPIERHSDDSICREIQGRPYLLRRARGYAPLPLILKSSMKNVLAVGAHLKNTVALSCGNEVFVSQHIGDLETELSYQTFIKTIDDLKKLLNIEPDYIACDLHPDYLSSQYAEALDLPLHRIQHHHAHIAGCMAENDLTGQVLGVAWDGTGYGPDGTIWGGEFLTVSLVDFDRFLYFRPFPLPGGDTAVKEPGRSALGLLYMLADGDLSSYNKLSFFNDYTEKDIKIISAMLEKDFNSPLTSSAGRIFDAVAAICGLYSRISFEGQAAMALEALTRGVQSSALYPYSINSVSGSIDLSALVFELIKDLELGLDIPLISVKFHNTLAEIITEAARLAGMERVVLSGGCFQNRYLLEAAVRRLKQAGFRPYWHQRVPANDGGISLGQAAAASARIKEGL